MKLLVCIKQVPDSWAEKKMVGGLLDRANVDAVLNDLDEYAVEEALRIAEAHGGNEEGGANTVTVISMGPERATEAVGPFTTKTPSIGQLGGSATRGMDYMVNLTNDGILRLASDQNKTIRPEYATYVYIHFLAR